MKSGRKIILTSLAALIVLAGFAVLLSPGVLAWTIQYAEEGSLKPSGEFPVTVDPAHKAIVESPQVNAFLANEHSLFGAAVSETETVFWNGISGIAQSLVSLPWYESAASVAGRVVVLRPGMRKEEVAAAFGKALGWKPGQQKEFMTASPCLLYTSPSPRD